MREPTFVSTDGTTAEAVATASLFLIFTSVIAFVVGLAAWGMSDVLVAAVAGAIAVISFAASIVCFRAQAGEREHLSAS